MIHVFELEGTFEVDSTSTRPRITVTADGLGVVSHVGSRLVADVADRSTLCGELSDALAGLRKPRATHDPGRILVDLAVAVADGARTISDIAVLGDQAVLFGPVASDSTCWRLLDALDGGAVAAVGRARGAGRGSGDGVGPARREPRRGVRAGDGRGEGTGRDRARRRRLAGGVSLG